MRTASVFLAGAAAAAWIDSIAASNILLGLAIVAIVAARAKLRWPPVTIPLIAWMGWTVLSLVVNGHERQGFPQIKKFYVYLIVFVVYIGIRRVAEVRWIALAWVAGGALSAAWSMEQFYRKFAAARAAHVDFYTSYVGQRITGFMDHWMTFSGHMMMALMIAMALLLFAKERRWVKALLMAAGLLITAGLLAAFTRSMWPGAALGGVYLLWFRQKWLVAAVPVLAGIVLLANPFDVRERVVSMVRPHAGQVDSNEHREVLRRVGWEMIKAHPLFGVGPEQVKSRFMEYLPADVARPIPKEWYYDHLHNIYYHFGAERGLPALAALLWMFGRALLDFARGLRRLPRDADARWVLHAAIAVILAFLVSGWGEVNFGDSEVLGMLLAVIGCGYVALQCNPNSDSAEGMPISTPWNSQKRPASEPASI